jgi:putative membrane protein
MKKFAMFFIGFVFLVLIAGPKALIAGDDKNPDKKFIKKAASAGLMEVELGKFAQENGTSQDVKDFGKMMETDHSKANEELKAIAQKNNKTVPEKMKDKHLEKVKELKAKKGSEFDKEYMDAMVEDHEKDIEEFESALEKVQNQELKDWIDKTLPTLKNHLAEAKRINDQIAAK